MTPPNISANSSHLPQGHYFGVEFPRHQSFLNSQRNSMDKRKHPRKYLLAWLGCLGMAFLLPVVFRRRPITLVRAPRTVARAKRTSA